MSRTRLATHAVLLVAAASRVLVAQALPDKATVARLTDSLAKAYLAERPAPALSIAVVRGRDTLVFSGWGKANLELDVTADARTVYRIGSVTKQFTAVQVLQQVDSGRVQLDAPIGRYLPSLPTAWHAVTVRQLLNHTSGIRNYTSVGLRWVRRWGEEMLPDTMLALVANDTFDFAPGTNWRYNNTGYVILGLLVEKITGRAWGKDLDERLFKPLGLADTRNCLAGPVVPRRASGYSPTTNGFVNATYLAMSQPFGAGALCSTVGDLARWNQALHGGQLLSAASYAAMTTPAGAAIKSHYGFGMGRDSTEARTLLLHGGGINGFLSANAWEPARQLSVTVLTNGDGGSPDKLLQQLVRASLGFPLERPPMVVAIAPAELGKYAGTYALATPGGTRNMIVKVVGGALAAQIEGQDPFPLVYYGRHSFGPSSDSSLRLNFSVVGDRSLKLTLVQDGGSFEGPRTS